MKTVTEIQPQAVVQSNHSGYIKTFGRIFAEFGKDGRNVVVDKMTELFPEKSESILRWVDWYKTYYNMGRIPGHDSPEKISWKK